MAWFPTLASVAAIRPLVWEPPYAMGVALESKTNKQTNKKQQQQQQKHNKR